MVLMFYKELVLSFIHLFSMHFNYIIVFFYCKVNKKTLIILLLKFIINLCF